MVGTWTLNGRNSSDWARLNSYCYVELQSSSAGDNTRILVKGENVVKVACIALSLAVSLTGPAHAQMAPDAKAALTQYYSEYLAKIPWGPASAATTFKSFYLGQHLTVGEGTPFVLCKPIKDINGENTCWAPDHRNFVCPFTPPIIKCSGRDVSSNAFTPEERSPVLTAALTAFGNRVQPSLVIFLDDWFPDAAKQRFVGRLAAITIKAEGPSTTFVPIAIDHFTKASGRQPKISVDDKDKDIISRECKSTIDNLYAGRANRPDEVADALNRCETESLEKFFISTTRSVFYAWTFSDPGFLDNKRVAMGVHRELMGTRVITEMSYDAGNADREFKAKVNALLEEVKATKEKRNKDDF